MDATISVVCYKSKVLSNGESPIMVRVAKDGKRSMKSLGVSVNPVYWDFAKNCPKKNCPNRTVLMQLISQTLLQYQGKVMEVKVKGEDVTASTIITENEVKSNKVTLEDFLTSHIQQLRDNGKVGNSYAYLNLRTTLHNFHGKKLNLLFNAVDVASSLSEHQFCQILGRMRLYQYLPMRLQRNIPRLLITDTQINNVAKSYISDEDFGSYGTDINMWNFYNLLTGANKSSYIDMFLDRSLNASEIAMGINGALHGEERYKWFID